MALLFDNCLIQVGGGANYLYGGCCCQINCDVTATADITIDTLSYQFLGEDFYISSGLKIIIGGVTQSFPIFLNSGDSFNLQMEICAVSANNTDFLTLDFTFVGGSDEKFDFQFVSIDFTSSVSPSSFSFGNTVIGNTKTLGLQIENLSACCTQFELTTDCPDVLLSQGSSDILCNGDKQTNIKIDWTPLTLGAINCNLTISNGCYTQDFPITGNAINAPSGGGTTVTQKNKVDQTTRVEGCSPRTANNRCQTAQTMQSAIRTNARRFGKR